MAGLNVTIDAASLAQVQRNIRELPKKMRNKHVYVALMAAGGVFKPAVKANAPKETGLLKGSVGVKAGIPKTEGKQPWVAVGSLRGKGTLVAPNKSGKIRRASAKRISGLSAGDQAAAMRLKAKYRRMTMAQRDAQDIIDRADKQQLKPRGFRMRTPTRYAHLMEKKTKYMSRAQAANEQAAAARLAEKLTQAVANYDATK